MKLKPTAIVIFTAFGACTLAQSADANPTVKGVEFIGMVPPASIEERADIYSKAQMKVTYKNGKSKIYDLKYHQLMATTDVINGSVVGGLWDHKDSPIDDNYGQMASDAPDGNSLMSIQSMGETHHHENHGHNRNSDPALVTNFEYREVPTDYPKVPYTCPTCGYWSKLPATMGLSKLDQDKKTGALKVRDYDHINFAKVNGGWIHCAASFSPWNTHLSSEEYEPDAKVRGGFAAKAADSDDSTDIVSFSQYYFGNQAAANPYHYGLVPEVKVRHNGTSSVEKHYALGRFARELADVQPDERTAYMGDDGAYTGMFMFVSDRKGDLSRGTLYAAKWKQTSDANGGSADLDWIRLGHASDKEIKALVDGGIEFGDIFDVSNSDPNNISYKKIKTYMGTEWLRLKPNMEKAAAFLETRRYAALLGATTEFTKMEGVTHNAKDKKTYVVISRVETGMLVSSTDPKDDIHVKRNDGGAIYELELKDWQKDTDDHQIMSSYVARKMTSIPELLGGWLGGTKDAEGNRCDQNKICGGDNIKYAENMRTLFIGEDTSRRNNNYVWAFNLDTRKLSRILSAPMYAEATGLQAVEDLNGYSYIMSNFQHPGEESQKGEFLGVKLVGPDEMITEADVLDEINTKWDNRKKAAIGYIGTKEGALPTFK